MLAQVVLFDGFDPLDAVGPYETLMAGGMHAEQVTAEGPREEPAGLTMLSLNAIEPLNPERADVTGTPVAAARDEQDHDIWRSPRPPRGSGPLPAYRADGGRGCRSAICGQLRRVVRSEPSCPQIVERGLDNPISQVKFGFALRGGLPPGWAGPRASALSHLIERNVSAQKAHELETIFAHERRGTVWRAA